MDNLPTEVLTEILNKLDLNMMLECRLVSKKWKFVIGNNVKIKNLTVKGSDNFYLNDRYSFTFRPTSHDVLFSTQNYNFFQAEFFKSSILNNLRTLFLAYSIEVYEDQRQTIFSILNSVNLLEKLEQLAIESLSLKRNAVIRLPKLQYLTIDEFEGHQLVLETPSLHSFKIKDGYANIKFNYQENIKTLSLMDFHNDITKFKNLECLYLKYLQDDAENDENSLGGLLTALPKLREFHCGPLSTLKDIVYNIMLDKEELRRTNFRLYFSSLEITNLKDLDELAPALSSYLINLNLHFQLVMQNYSKLTYFVPWIRKLNYTELVNRFDGEIESNFHDRFYNIDTIVVKQKIKDQEQFFEFIRGFRILSELALYASSLDQSFYDRLPICKNIQLLETYDQIANYDFVVHLTKLSVLKINQLVTYDLISKAFRHLPELNQFYFRINNKPIEVFSALSGTYHKIRFDDESNLFDGRENLLLFLQNLISCFE